jgi:tetratricopeptide (TPR) repeat protein
MGLFYLLTLYCAIRFSTSGGVRWPVAAALFCAAGMATKEVMVTAPLIVLLYDRTFLAGSFAGALRKRWRLYAALAACWGLLVYLMAGAGNRGGTAGFGAKDVPQWWPYAQTQCWAILKYLSLAVWPRGLCLDYGSSFSAAPWQVALGAVVVGSIVLATLWGLFGGRKWAFLGACFLAILAPTSSIVPIRDPIFEHRMYLPLAAVLAAAVLGAFGLWERRTRGRSGFRDQRPARQWVAPSIALAAVAAGLGTLTAFRNYDYRSHLAIVEDSARKAPANPRARLNFGWRLLMTRDPRDLPRAIVELRESVRLDPTDPVAHFDLSRAFSAREEFDEAVVELREAIRLEPGFALAHNTLGATLYNQGKNEHNPGKIDQAIDQFRQAIRLNSAYPRAYENLSTALRHVGRYQEANEAAAKARELESSATTMEDRGQTTSR